MGEPLEVKIDKPVLKVEVAIKKLKLHKAYCSDLLDIRCNHQKYGKRQSRDSQIVPGYLGDQNMAERVDKIRIFVSLHKKESKAD